MRGAAQTHRERLGDRFDMQLGMYPIRLAGGAVAHTFNVDIGDPSPFSCL